MPFYLSICTPYGKYEYFFSAYALIVQRIQVSHIIDYHQGNLKGQRIVKNADVQPGALL